MRSALVEANPDLVAEDPEWVVRIVGSEGERVRLLEAFCDPESPSPVVATTSKMLSTGVDVQDLRFVVLFKPVGSMVEFKQIIGGIQNQYSLTHSVGYITPFVSNK
jgi:type I restriction enzyme R subunit